VQKERTTVSTVWPLGEKQQVSEKVGDSRSSKRGEGGKRNHRYHKDSHGKKENEARWEGESEGGGGKKKKRGARPGIEKKMGDLGGTTHAITKDRLPYCAKKRGKGKL